MHHAFLTGTLPKLEMPEKTVTRTDTAEVVVLDLLHTETADKFVYVVMVQQEELRQDILIEVRPHRDGYHVGLMRFGSPILTTGISDAVKLIASNLETAGMTIEDTWY
jgi:tRNA (guanine-N7-)-methyltransferase